MFKRAVTPYRVPALFKALCVALFALASASSFAAVTTYRIDWVGSVFGTESLSCASVKRAHFLAYYNNYLVSCSTDPVAVGTWFEARTKASDAPFAYTGSSYPIYTIYTIDNNYGPAGGFAVPAAPVASAPAAAASVPTSADMSAAFFGAFFLILTCYALGQFVGVVLHQLKVRTHD